jgi:hypothetical protein
MAGLCGRVDATAAAIVARQPLARGHRGLCAGYGSTRKVLVRRQFSSFLLAEWTYSVPALFLAMPKCSVANCEVGGDHVGLKPELHRDP